MPGKRTSIIKLSFSMEETHRQVDAPDTKSISVSGLPQALRLPPFPLRRR